MTSDIPIPRNIIQPLKRMSELYMSMWRGFCGVYLSKNQLWSGVFKKIQSKFKKLYLVYSVIQHPIQETERSSEELYKIKYFHRQKEAGTRKLQTKRGLVMARWTFLQGMAEVCQLQYITSADQRTPDRFKIPFLGELKLSFDLVAWGLANKHDSMLGLFLTGIYSVQLSRSVVSDSL